MIETSRLVLARPSLADFEESFALARDEEMTRYIGGKPATREDAWRSLLQRIGHWTAFGYGLFTLRTKDDNAFVGEAGLAHFSRGLGDTFDPFPEAAWMIAPHGHGRGYGTEAIMRVHAWMEETHAMARSVCIIHPDNEASLSLAARTGYVRYDETSYRGGNPLMLERRVA